MQIENQKSKIENVLVPDIGDFSDIPVIEIQASVGDVVEAQQSLITLESDKATMEVPAPFSGIIKEVLVKNGDTVSQGSLIFKMEVTKEITKTAAISHVEPKVSELAASTMQESILVPDLGDFSNVPVIEVLVAVGDKFDIDQPLLTLESDKATMEVPAPFAGTVKELKINVGDAVSKDNVILIAEFDNVESQLNKQVATVKKTQSETQKSVIENVTVPDIGDFTNVPVIEVQVSVGDTIQAEQPLITLESDKATMEVPAPFAGVIREILVKAGDSVSEGSLIFRVETTEGNSAAPIKNQQPAVASSPTPTVEKSKVENTSTRAQLREPQHAPTAQPSSHPRQTAKVHAGPAVRKLARELGVNLAKVTGSGRKGRILKDDVKIFVKTALTQGLPTAATQVATPTPTMGIPDIPEIDFSKFGEIETQPLSRIKKLSGQHLHRAWLNVPHVTQFDEADITELEAFRNSLKAEAEKQGVKVTMLAFLLKASVAALKTFPHFNASLDKTKENLVLKKYYHIGVAVDTANGLVVPVIKDVNYKGLFDLARELGEISKKARDGKLSPSDMQGGTFTISSLGGIGGTQFTPIVNAPEVAILGVSRASMQPVYDESTTHFVPRLMMPFSVSYDHRVIDGAAGARFTQYLSFILSDVRRLLL